MTYNELTVQTSITITEFMDRANHQETDILLNCVLMPQEAQKFSGVI
ncbi:TPA: hypothetical protein H6V48_004328 [Escherichia coli]|nr:hypothetical protein [Escherichia coli]